MKVVIFSSSLRAESYNSKLIKQVYRKLEHISDLKVKLIDLKKLSLPLYDGDVEAAGMPTGVVNLAEEIASSDAMIISSPEYNHGICGVFKNTIDWLSRIKPLPLKHKSLLLMSASTSGFGGIRGVEQAKPSLSTLGVLIFTQEFTLSFADKAFEEDGTLKDQQLDKILEQTLGKFIGFAQKNLKLLS